MNAGMLHRGIPFVWVLTSGEAGMRSQALGLAEALGWPYEEKRYDLRGPWRHLPAPVAVRLARWRWGGAAAERALAGMAVGGIDPISPPWPDLVIACGRRAQVATLLIKQASRGRTFTVYIQNPRISPHHFDLVAAPEHDAVRGPNVVTTPLALHHVTPQRLQEARERWLPRWMGLFPRPWVGVLVGGPSRSVRWDGARFRQEFLRLEQWTKHACGSLFVTTSRRTPSKEVRWLQDRVGSEIPGWVWSGEGENPYFGILTCSDRLSVTQDSVSMISEAIESHRPVWDLSVGELSPRLRAFSALLRQKGWLTEIGGDAHTTMAPYMNPTATVAREVRRRFTAHCAGG